ncbi:S-adenosylmethionine-dependent methyltransferase Rv2258c-like [Asterias amurensis]|uniref:S-adenosylmethionine-dependent methyltransferase Rv2258c-like n=1 Tax=Asterias amurensis TaxID=7602 RepID=UPI003AB48704
MAESEETFGNRVAETVTQGFLCLALSVGHKTGLFETMAGFDDPKSAKEIADAAGLKERYVREWLGAMVSGSIVEVDDDTSELFLLPPHRRAAVTRLGDIVDWSMVAQGLPLVSGVYEKVAQCMALPGPSGLSSSEYSSGYHRWRDQCYDTFVQTSLLEAVIPSIPGLENVLEQGTDVVEITSNTGSAIRKLARAFPDSRCVLTSSPRTTTDGKQCDPSINTGSPYRQFNLKYETQDPTKLPADWSNKFGVVIAIQNIRDSPRPDVIAQEVHRILKPDGLFTMIESNMRSRIADNKEKPTALFVYTTSLFGSLPQSLSEDNGLGLGAAFGRESFKPFLEKAGFKSINLVPVPGDPMDSVSYVCKK